MSTRRILLRPALVCAAALGLAPFTAGCLFSGTPDDDVAGSTYGGTGSNPTNEDEAQYDELADQLDQGRSEFLGDIADEHRAVHRRLYWLEFAAFDPTLHGYDVTTGARTDYGFSVGGGDGYNFEASESVIATAMRDGDEVIVRAYAADAPATELGEAILPAPTDEQRWWAYAVDGNDVYIVTTGNGTTLLKWTPGAGNPAPLFTLEETGAEVGSFLSFGVEHGHMVFLESGRAWALDLATKHSSFLGNDTEVDGPISFDDAGVFLPTASGPLYYELATGALSNVADRIGQSGFSINDTFASAHLYESDGFLFHGSVYYVGSSGVFAFDLASGAVRPLLLEPHSDAVRIEYRYPEITDDGSLFVVGLTSTSGSVGADGPVYQVKGAAAY